MKYKTDPSTSEHELSNRTLYQFSVRDLFKLTAFSALLFSAIVLGRNQEFVVSHPRIATLLGLSPIAAVLAVDWFRIVTPRALAISSGLLYGVSLFTVALRWDDRPVWGGTAFFWSFPGTTLFAEGGIAKSLISVACIAGILTNAAFIWGGLCIVASFKFEAALEHAHLAAKKGTFLAIALLVPLWLTGVVDGLFVGYGLWTASLLALALGTKQR